MHFRISTLLSAAVLFGAFAFDGQSATLAGTSVTGSLVFSGDPSNYFDPGYGFASPGDLNAIDGSPTVTISDAAVEFGYDDGFANAISADFTASMLTVTDVVEGTGANLGFTMTFSDSAFAGLNLTPVNSLTLIDSYSSASGVFTLSSPGGNVTAGEIFTDTFIESFNAASVPEPSTHGFVGLALLAFGTLGFRTFRKNGRRAENTKYASKSTTWRSVILR
jgi:hypothetical protein